VSHTHLFRWSTKSCACGAQLKAIPATSDGVQFVGTDMPTEAEWHAYVRGYVPTPRACQPPPALTGEWTPNRIPDVIFCKADCGRYTARGRALSAPEDGGWLSDYGTPLPRYTCPECVRRGLAKPAASDSSRPTPVPPTEPSGLAQEASMRGSSWDAIGRKVSLEIPEFETGTEGRYLGHARPADSVFQTESRGCSR
jgi:hypothetical protein